MISRSLKFVLLAVVFISGCKSNTIIDEYRATETSVLNKHEAVVVLGRRYKAGYETEYDFVECVGDKLSENGNDINVIPEKKFVDGLYPYFETSTAPMDVKNLDKLIKNKSISEKIDDFNIRYFIWIDGKTEATDKTGSLTCAIGPGGGGCFGFATWDDEANYEASIWDFNQIQLSGKINTETKGTSFMPAIVIPIPMLAQVQDTACKALSKQIRTFFSEQS